MTNRRRLLLVSIAVAGFAFALLRSGSAQAASTSELISDYDVHFSDQFVSIMNPLASNGCAQIYVFDDAQDLQYCCACPVSSNGLLDLSVEDNLLGVDDASDRGVIEILPSQQNLQGKCDATKSPFGSGAALQAATYQTVPTFPGNFTNVSSDGPFLVKGASTVKTYFANVTVGSPEMTKLAKLCQGTPSCSCGLLEPQ